MHIKVFGIILILGLTQIGITQSAFHRTYPSNSGKEIVCISSMQLKDDTYIALEMMVEVDQNKNKSSDTIIITSYKPKGDINWSKRISLPDSLKGYIPYLKESVFRGSIIQGSNDSIYFSIATKAPGTPNKIIGALDSGGANGWMRSYTTDPGKADGNTTGHLLVNYNKTFFSGHIGGNALENDVAISRKNYLGNNIWSKLLSAKGDGGRNVSEQVTHLSIVADTTILMTGIIDTNNVTSFLTVLDTFGNVRVSKRYNDVQAISMTKAYSAIRLADSTYMIGGLSVEINAQFTPISKGFIIKTTKTGDVAWGKKIAFDLKDITKVHHLALAKDGNILISGINENTQTLKSFYFVIKINSAGQTIWKKKYPRVDGIREINGNLFVTKDNGAALIVNAAENGKINPSFIKIDNSGSSSCQEDILEEIFTNNTYLASNLTWTTRDAGTSSTQSFKSTTHSYDVPTLSLNVRPFCPNEPIDWTFRVRTKGATFYEWSTGEKGPLLDTLRVFKEGEYSVTVTIGESVCYKLCDTSMISRYDKPKAQLSLGLGTFCTTNNQLLLLGYTPGHPQIKTINWSTGASNVSSIDIAQPGLYKVTLVDGCNESASAEVTVGTFPRKITSATIAPQVTVNCFSGSITGTLTATGNSSGLGIERYLWSTGETTRAKSINGSTVRTYTVTVTDGCGTSVTANTTIELKGDGIRSVTLVADNSKLCTQKIIELNAVTQVVANYTYRWSDGSSQPKLAVTTAGTYTVTVTDLCGNTATASGEVKESDLTPKSLEYANVFFPDGVDYRFQGGNNQDTLAFEALKLNRTFGPINRPEYCINQVENYEFYIFNRWGQTVFESKDIRQEWDGLIKESKAQGDTYVYVVKYSILGASITVKGDVTMIRL